MRKPHGPATARRAKIQEILKDLLHRKHPDPCGAAARKVKVGRRTVLNVARRFGIDVPARRNKRHKLAALDRQTFLAMLKAQGAQAIARYYRCSAQAVYMRAHAFGHRFRG